MKGIYIAALAVLLCCHVLLVQSSNTPGAGGRGNNKGKNSAKKNKPSAKKDVAPPFSGVDSAAASQEEPTDNTVINPFVISDLSADQESAGNLSSATQPREGKASRKAARIREEIRNLQRARKGEQTRKRRGKQGQKNQAENKLGKEKATKQTC